MRKIIRYARKLLLFCAMTYIGLLIAPVIISGIGGIASLFGAMEVHVSAALAPEFSPGKYVPVVTASNSIAWNSYPAEHGQEIKEVLSEPNGWTRAGINYKFLSSHAYGSGEEKPLDVIFLILPEETVADLCRDSRTGVACASPQIRDTFTVPPIKLSITTPGIHSKVGAQCTILLGQEMLSNQSSLFPFRFVIINHEVGHCLGFKHSKEPYDIMKESQSDWTHSPSQKEIDFIKTKIAKK